MFCSCVFASCIVLSRLFFVVLILFYGECNKLLLLFTECNPEAVRQLHTSDISNVTLGNGPLLFSGILIGDPRFFWGSSGLPNIGTMIFDDVYVLLGLSTQGAFIVGTNEETYVSNFTLQFSNSSTEPYDVVKVCNPY